MKVKCYSNETGKALLQLCVGKIDGAVISSCHSSWYKKCKKSGRCERYLPQGMYWQRRKVAELLKKSPLKLSDKIFYKKKEEFEREGFKNCRLIEVSIKNI